jgi:transketolase
MDKSLRDEWGNEIVRLAESDEDIIVLSADSQLSFRLESFKKKFPHRLVEVGIAEQNLANIAAGLATLGKKPFITTYSVFLSMRACEQVRTFIAYPNLNVKIIGANGGIYAGEREGPTHQAFEDISIFRTIPNIMILVPTDANELRGALMLALKHEGPVYVRLGGPPTPVYEYKELTAGQIEVLSDFGNDISIFATGVMVFKALDAAKLLRKENILVKVIKVDKIKPIDMDMVIKYLKSTRRAITCEDHLINGGLGSAISEIIAENVNCVLRRIGLRDVFPESGTGEDLFDKYTMNTQDIINTSRELMQINNTC